MVGFSCIYSVGGGDSGEETRVFWGGKENVLCCGGEVGGGERGGA